MIVGVLARAQRYSPVEIHAFVFLSNHYHLLLSVSDALQLSRFMNFLNSNLAREAGRLHGWKEKFWGRRYQAVLVSEEEEAQIGRLRYLLSHGCKEGLVAHPSDWPGVHCAEALTTGRPVVGLWRDRTQESLAKGRGEATHQRSRFVTKESFDVAPLPCWHHLSNQQWRHRIRGMIEEIQSATAVHHAQERSRPMGARAILSQRPHDRPQDLQRSRAPVVHAASKSVRDELLEAYRWFVGAFREAASGLRKDHRHRGFPEGSFPPGSPFVAISVEMAPG